MLVRFELISYVHVGTHALGRAAVATHQQQQPQQLAAVPTVGGDEVSSYNKEQGRCH